MTGVEVFVEGHTVHLVDDNGPATIPARVIHLLSHTANQSTAACPGASWGLRWFDRDALNAARDLLDRADRCDQCKDERGTEDMGDGKKFCPGCCSAAAGSHYDDKTEF